MKTLILLFLLLPLSLTTLAENKEVKMETTVIPTVTRSIIQKPVVTIDDLTFQLSIKLFASNESFTVYVYDENGAVIYQDNLITDGGNHNYMLPTLDYGNYSLVIEGERVSYEGQFDI